MPICVRTLFVVTGFKFDGGRNLTINASFLSPLTDLIPLARVSPIRLSSN